MRRETAIEASLVVLLVAAAGLAAVPFREEALRRLTVPDLSWDAALHGLSGLDLFDDLRLLRPLDALGDILSQHWWGPLFALVSVPFHALFGRSLATATLPSFVAYLLAAPAAFLAGRRALGRLDAFETVALAVLTGAFVLRAPMLLETSAWIMLESLSGLLAVAALGLFAGPESARARRAAFALGAALVFLKVHYGAFVLVTLGVAAWRREEPRLRGALRAAAARALGPRAWFALLGVAGALAAGRLLLEAKGGDALARRLPSVGNVLWGTFVLSLLFVLARRAAWAEAWRAAPSALRDFAWWGLAPFGAWCLDPANVRGWYRQIFLPTDAPYRPLVQFAAFAGFLRGDYALAALPFGLVLAGLALALVLPGSAARRTLAAFATWPVLLMSLNRFPVEARFLGCFAPALFAAAAAGLIALAARLPRPVGRATLLAAVAALAATLVSHEAGWRREADSRATYRYPYDEVGRAAVAAALAAAPAAGPVRIVLPAEPLVWPTVRLGIRLARPDVPPADVSVETR
jgi:hypothetical protein